MIDADLSSALIAFVGTPGGLDDKSREDRVAEALGVDAALDQLPRVKGIVDGMYSADPPLWNAPSVMELGEQATRWLQARHPELSSVPCEPSQTASRSTGSDEHVRAVIVLLISPRGVSPAIA